MTASGESHFESTMSSKPHPQAETDPWKAVLLGGPACGVIVPSTTYGRLTIPGPDQLDKKARRHLYERTGETVFVDKQVHIVYRHARIIEPPEAIAETP